MNATEQTPWGTYPLDSDEVPSNQRHLLARQVRRFVLMGRMYRAFVAFCFLFSWLIAGALVVGIAYLINPEYLNGSYLVAFASAYFFLRLAPPVMALRVIRKLREIGSDSPPGIKLKRDRAPKLFELIDEVVAKTKSRPIEGVCLIGEESLSAGVIKSKERGGRLQRYLTVPLPLLDVLSPEQFRAALTQSLLTCSDPHIDAVWQGQMECRIWFLLTYGLGAPTEITGFRTFGTRYYQQLFAMTNRLMRSIQRGATIQTGNLVSRQSMADAGIIQSGRLTYVTIQASDQIRNQAKDSPEPPNNAFEQYRDALSDPSVPRAMRQQLNSRLQLNVPDVEGLPSLQEIVLLLGLWPESGDPEAVLLPPPPATSAAQAFLGATEASLRRAMNDRWLDEYADKWKAQHAEVVAARARLAEIERRTPEQRKDPDVAWEYALLTAQIGDPDLAIPLLGDVIRTQSWRVPARLHAARLLLEREDSRGLELLEPVMHRAPHQYVTMRHALWTYFLNTNQPRALEEVDATLRALESELQEATYERAYKELNTARRLPTIVDPELRSLLQHHANKSRDLSRIIVLQLKVKHLATVPSYYVMLDFKDTGNVHGGSSGSVQFARQQESARRIIEDLSGTWWGRVEAHLRPMNARNYAPDRAAKESNALVIYPE